MYELVWQVVDSASVPVTALRPAPTFAFRAAAQPVAATLASLQLLQSRSQPTTGRSRLSISARSAIGKPSFSQASSMEVGRRDALP